MEFSKTVQDQFKLAGWTGKEDKNVVYDGIINDFPEFLKSFLAAYGDVIVNDKKSFESKVISTLKIKPEVTFILSKDVDGYDYLYEKLGIELYVFAYYEPEGYYVACDTDGKVYLFGDYVFRIADTLQQGIENLVLFDWSKGYYELDENGNWFQPKHK